MWKWFKLEEVAGVSDRVIDMLDTARALYGAPIKITCGVRSPIENAALGGAPDSAHCKGLAVDMAVAPIGEWFDRERLAWALGAAGFKRLEICPRHYHVDTDPAKVSPCCWKGEDK